MTSALVHLTVPLLHVADVARSVDFYRRLGFEEDPDTNPDRPSGTALRSGDARLLLVARQGGAAADRSPGGLVLYVSDLLEVRDRLGVSGVRPENLVMDAHAPHGELLATDPDGHLLVVRSLHRAG